MLVLRTGSVNSSFSIRILAVDSVMLLLGGLLCQGSIANRLMLVRAFHVGSRRPIAYYRTGGKQNKLLQAQSRLLFANKGSGNDATSTEGSSIMSSIPEPMANIYQEWTIDQDRMLWDNRRESISTIASIMGRGIRGVEKRLTKLKDVNSKAYERLFSDQLPSNTDDEVASLQPDGTPKQKKLVPVSEVLRRIQWDTSLSPKDFYVLHYDRVDDNIVESPFDAPNTNIEGIATSLIDALPEHRIVGVKFRERVVWDREKKLDLVFSGPGIANVQASYEQWKRERDALIEFNRQRQEHVSQQLQQVLGLERFALLQEMSHQLQAASPGLPPIVDIEGFVRKAVRLFREVRNAPESSLAPALIPMSDYDALDQLSELIALLPDTDLRPIILTEISRAMAKREGSKLPPPNQQALPSIREDEIKETFVRGSGAGGQKINVTSNCVVLVHCPTGLRVKCQDTRSLQQNRKIARKRLQLKLDEFLNGSQSRASLQAKKVALKKTRAKSRSRAKQRQKHEDDDVAED